MRTNIEDDIISSGRLGAFSRAAKLLHSALPEAVKEELIAMGALVFTYRDSQVKRFTTGARGRLQSILTVRFGSVADQVIDAMLSSQLATERNAKISVKGNRAHVSRLKSLRAKSSNGGKIRAGSATRGKGGVFVPGKSQAEHQAAPAVSSDPAPAPAPAPALKTNTGEPPSLSEGDGARKLEVRSTRGAFEALFEAEFIDRGKSAGVTVAKFDALENSIGGQLIRRCGEERITQEQLLSEWWHPSWRHWHGFDVRALAKHFAKVRAAIDDPRLRPLPPKQEAREEAPAKRVVPDAIETERKLEAERQAREAESFVAPDEAARRFAEMRRNL
jgi:hypothetical protein